MGAPTKKISQDTFDEAVVENVVEFDMEPDEAVQQAIEEFESQGVNLDGIIKDYAGEGGRAAHPVIAAVKSLEDSIENDEDNSEVVKRLAAVDEFLGPDALEGAAEEAGRNGGIQAALAACRKLLPDPAALPAAMKTLKLLLTIDQNRDFFYVPGGGCQFLVKECLERYATGGEENAAAIQAIAEAGAAACTKNETNKVEFMKHDVPGPACTALASYQVQPAAVKALCELLKALTTGDDPREPASAAFRHGRELAKVGAATTLLSVLAGHVEKWEEDTSMVGTLCATLKAVAVNEEVCKEVAEAGGVPTVLRLLRADGGGSGTVAVARPACQLLRQLAGSDSIKPLVIDAEGFQAVLRVLASHIHNEKASTSKAVAATIEQALGVLTALTLRNPAGAVAAAAAGCLEATLEVMKAVPAAEYVQRQACMFIRNAVSRSAENKAPLLKAGAEALLLAAKANHPKICVDVGSAALRDLGVENYNEGWKPTTMVMGADGKMRTPEELEEEYREAGATVPWAKETGEIKA